MSFCHSKMTTIGVNTESCLLNLNVRKEVEIASRLKERDVKHIKVNDSSELEETYDFGQQIGQGGFGTVISVVEKQTEKDWAMKIVSKTAVGKKIESVYREIHILKMVDHPHIIYLDKVYESSKNLYLVLERCYDALSAIFKIKRRFSEIETKKIIKDLISAVAYLHKNDIVHRDLKLENILMAKNPNDSEDDLYIKLTDFGLSIVKQGRGYENMLHDCCGTLVYMAPEMITCRSYSQQCDVWAVGVIMFMLLSGRLPFYANKDQDLAAMICKEEPSYTGFVASSEALHLVRKLLTKNPALRITATEVIEHPWVVGKQMTHDSNLSDNVLDMMRMWRSELTLPIPDECDWVSCAKALGSASSTPIEKEQPPTGAPARNKPVQTFHNERLRKKSKEICCSTSKKTSSSSTCSLQSKNSCTNSPCPGCNATKDGRTFKTSLKKWQK